MSSSYNKRQKDYAKKLLNKHVSSFYSDDTLEHKYGIITDKGITKVNDDLIKYLTKEADISSVQAIDLVINEYNLTKKKRDKVNSVRKIDKKDYIDRYKDAEKNVNDKAVKSKNILFNDIDFYNAHPSPFKLSTNYYKRYFNLEEDVDENIFINEMEGNLYMIYDEENLYIFGEAVDILIEEYGFDEDEAIELVNEAYNEELNSIFESIDILVEDYGFDEDEAIELISETYDELLYEDKVETAVKLAGKGIEIAQDERTQHAVQAAKGFSKGYGNAIAIAGGIAATAVAKHGVKCGVNSIKRKNRQRKLNKELKHIAKTGKRTSKYKELLKESKIDNYIPETTRKQIYDNRYYIGGSVAGSLVAVPVAKYIKKSVKEKIDRDRKRDRERYVQEFNDAEMRKRKAVEDYRRRNKKRFIRK